jgi:dipeptidyl aminopeptidase/acylaminoacyl peptidase
VSPNAPIARIDVEGAIAPDGLRRAADGRLVGVAGTRLVAFDPDEARLVAFARVALAAGSSIAWPIDPQQRGDTLWVKATVKGRQHLRTIDLRSGRQSRGVDLPAAAELLGVDSDGLLWRETTRDGLFLRRSQPGGGVSRTLLALDTHLAGIAWGQTRLIDYAAADGTPLKAAVILPPGYSPGRRYPVITWIYPGHMVRGLDDYSLDPFMPGLYNLQLYAARG